MTLDNITLPKELERLVRHQVESGMYENTSALICEALRCFFLSDDDLTPQELCWLREDVQKRCERLKKGEEKWVGSEAFLARMQQKYG